MAASYTSLTDFNSYWGYSETPDVSGNVGVNTYMSYPPPSSYWTLTSNGCTSITYEGTFDWDELRSCVDSDNNELTSVSGTDPTDPAIVLSGTLYVNLVSPLSYL